MMMPKILAVCTAQLIFLSSTKLDQNSHSRQHECRTKVPEESDWAEALGANQCKMDAA